MSVSVCRLECSGVQQRLPSDCGDCSDPGVSGGMGYGGKGREREEKREEEDEEVELGGGDWERGEEQHSSVFPFLTCKLRA